MGRRDLQTYRTRSPTDEGAVAARLDGTALHALGAVACGCVDTRSAKREAAMMHLARGEFHTFKGGEGDYLYLVPSAAVVKLDDTTQAVLDVLGDGEHQAADV